MGWVGLLAGPLEVAGLAGLAGLTLTGLAGLAGLAGPRGKLLDGPSAAIAVGFVVRVAFGVLVFGLPAGGGAERPPHGGWAGGAGQAGWAG